MGESLEREKYVIKNKRHVASSGVSLVFRIVIQVWCYLSFSNASLIRRIASMRSSSLVA